MILNKINIAKTVFTVVLFHIIFPANAQKITAKDTSVGIQDTTVTNIVSKVEKDNFLLKQTSASVSRTVQIRPIYNALVPIQDIVNKLQNRIDSSGKFMNLRSLNTLGIMLKQYSDELGGYKQTLTDYQTQLKNSNDTISKIAADTTLNVMFIDSGLTRQLLGVRKKAFRLDSIQKVTLARVTVLRNKVSLSLLQVRDMASVIDYRTSSLKRKMWTPEVAPLFSAKPASGKQTVFQLVGSSLSRTILITNFYISNQWDLLTIGLLVFIVVILWTWLNMRRVKKMPEANSILEQVYILKSRNIILGGLLGFFVCLPFFFGNPPMSVVHFCEFFRTVLLFIIVYPYFKKAAKPLWILLCVLWLFYALDDSFIETTLSERWILFITGIAFAWLCIKIIRNKEPHFVKLSESPVTKFLSVFCLAQIILSLLFNLTGRITLAKIMGISAVECLMLGIALKIFSTVILEAVYLQSEAYQETKLSEYINYDVLQIKYRRILWLLAVVAWLLSLIRDWTLYESVISMLTDFFRKTRSIGEYKFSFGNVVLFIGIIWLSVIISRMINFFFGQTDNSDPSKRKGIASVMLLVRLAIWAVGFLVAVAAAGIPLNQLTVMLGALSVGIGFGLQNIANNLVSGVILAFERPIQVGDQIEISGKSGTVKEIGVRSSKLSSGSGADIIIPNGDLLSQQLTNWTMKDLSKSVDFKIGIAYNSDIGLVKQIITDALSKNEMIEQMPLPSITLQAFADEALDVKVSFWVNNLSSANTIRSNAMLEVYKALNDAGIVLPYPIIRPITKQNTE